MRAAWRVQTRQAVFVWTSNLHCGWKDAEIPVSTLGMKTRIACLAPLRKKSMKWWKMCWQRFLHSAKIKWCLAKESRVVLNFQRCRSIGSRRTGLLNDSCYAASPRFPYWEGNLWSFVSNRLRNMSAWNDQKVFYMGEAVSPIFK